LVSHELVFGDRYQVTFHSSFIIQIYMENRKKHIDQSDNTS